MMVFEKDEFKLIVDYMDYTKNEYSKECLTKILKSKPKSYIKLIERQNTYKILIEKITNGLRIDYFKSELTAVYNFSKHIPIPKKKTIKSILFERYKLQSRDQFVYLIQFLNKIRIFLLAFYVSKSEYYFKDEIKETINYINILNIEQLSNKIIQSSISNNDIRNFHFQLYELFKNDDDNKLEKIWANFFYSEALFSIAYSLAKNNFKFPEIIFTNVELNITNCFNPLLTSKKIVKNTLQIDKCVTVVTGPNMSGKSTLLKSVGICIYLANIGCAVPAEKASIPIYNNIFIYLNHSDDIKQGMSHFMKELNDFKIAIQESIPPNNSFIIFDEMFRGTNITEAISLTKYVLGNLIKFKRSTIIISTHLFELLTSKEVPLKDIMTYYLDCKIEKNIPVFSYELKNGISEMKIAELLFKKEGLYNLLNSVK